MGQKLNVSLLFILYLLKQSHVHPWLENVVLISVAVCPDKTHVFYKKEEEGTKGCSSFYLTNHIGNRTEMVWI